MRFTATIKGLSGFQKQFISAAEDINDIVSGEVFAASQQFVAGAQRDAPKDTAFLAGSIRFQQNELVSTIEAASEHAPPMEFGTKGKYRPIPGTEAIAAQFKGMKSGDYFDFLNRILDWVIRKGIANRFSVKTRRAIKINIKNPGKGKAARGDYERLHDTAAAIAFSIIRHGLNPHPFFFKQQEIVWPEMVRKVGAKLKSHMKVNVIMPGEIFRPKIITV